jgi:hypothetical protein
MPGAARRGPGGRTAKDSGKFAKAFGELTAGCNACHQSMERGFIVMRVPTEDPFSDQRFAPPDKP